MNARVRFHHGIWNLQYRFYRRRGKQVYKLYEHDRFRAAYDFLCLRASAGEPVEELSEWWTEFQNVDDANRKKMVRVQQNRSKKQNRGSRSSHSIKDTYH